MSYLAGMTKLLLLSLLVQSSLQTQVKPFIMADNYDVLCTLSKLYDDITNEGLAFNPDHFRGYNGFKIASGFFKDNVPINHFFNRIDIYYYSNPSSGHGLPPIKMYIRYPRPSHGVHLTFINNYKVSQSDNDTIMLSMIVLNAKPYNKKPRVFYAFYLESLNTSDFAIHQTFISEIKFFIDTDPIPFSPVPIVFKSPNQTLQLDRVQPSLNLSCTVVNNGTFNWTWSGPGVSNAVIKVADTTRTSILMLSSISAANAGNYTCSASYLAMGESAWGAIEPNTNSKTINLIIYSSVSTPANTVIIEEGNDATLSCLFTGYLPINYKITWSGLIPSNVIIANYENIKFRTQHGGPSTSPAVQSIFKIKSAKVADSGLYTCSMSGTTLRETILLMVVTQKTSWQVELE